ncbi:MAG: SH3 domain-containing protein [Spirochaetes bacterium]|nr:SH3 domain-containing protein [Spirochaetota bacterium]
MHVNRFIISIFILVAFFPSVGLEAAESRWITADKGLRMREAPSETAKIIILIPHGSEVSFLEEQGREMTIGGAKGKWTKISWKGREGWAFGGFLSTSPPGEKAASLLPEGEWWMLTTLRGRDVIFHPCFADTPSIRVDRGNNRIHFSMGQEDLTLQILKATRAADGSIHIQVKTESGRTHHTAMVRFLKGGKITEWENLDGMHGNHGRFVESRFLSGYKTVEENDGNCGEP